MKKSLLHPFPVAFGIHGKFLLWLGKLEYFRVLVLIDKLGFARSPTVGNVFDSFADQD